MSKMNDPVFRQALVCDVMSIQEIRNSVTENTLSDPSKVTDEMCIEYLTKRGKGWLCLMDQQPVGFAIVDMKDHNVWALFIKPDFQGKGIGKQLHDMMLQWYFDQTDTPLWLGTEPGTRAEQFYRMQGWKNTGPHGNNELKFELSYDQWSFMHPEADQR